MNTQNMSAVEITRRKKVKAIRILSNLTYVDKMSDSEFRTVSEVVGLSLRQVERAWNNFVMNGYVDGHAKNNHVKSIITVSTKDNYAETYQKVLATQRNIKNVTSKRLEKAIKLYLLNTPLDEIQSKTGIGFALLYNALARLQQTGSIIYSKTTGPKIKSKKIFIPLDDMGNLNIVRAVRYAKYKASKGRKTDPCKGLNYIEKNRHLAYYHFLCAKFNVQPIY